MSEGPLGVVGRHFAEGYIRPTDTKDLYKRANQKGGQGLWPSLRGW